MGYRDALDVELARLENQPNPDKKRIDAVKAEMRRFDKSGEPETATAEPPEKAVPASPRKRTAK